MSFLEAVNEKYGELSPVQKRIADYMYKYPDEACFYSLREMANALGVTEVTVLRFARKLGFDSYVDMKKNLRDHLQARLLGNETLSPASAHSMTPCLRNLWPTSFRCLKIHIPSAGWSRC